MGRSFAFSAPSGTRPLGSDGSLMGFGGGLELKRRLLAPEGVGL